VVGGNPENRGLAGAGPWVIFEPKEFTIMYIPGTNIPSPSGHARNGMLAGLLLSLLRLLP